MLEKKAADLAGLSSCGFWGARLTLFYPALLAASEAEVQRLQQAQIQPQEEYNTKKHTIPRPPGERGKNGWNLQEHMGLKDNEEAYSNIRVCGHSDGYRFRGHATNSSLVPCPVQRCVRYAIYESQLDIWVKINQQKEVALFTCYALVSLYPYFSIAWLTDLTFI